MTKKKTPLGIPALSSDFRYVVRTSSAPFPVWVHSSGGKARTRKRAEAMVWENRDEASEFAEAIAGQVEGFTLEAEGQSPAGIEQDERFTPSQPTVPAAVTSAPEPTSEAPVVESSKGSTEAPSALPVPVLSLTDLQALVAASGLPVLQKTSAVHVGDPKGRRMVYVPAPRGIKRLYLYKCEDSTLPGFKTAEQRKAERLGQVTHVCEATLENATLFLAAVAK